MASNHCSRECRRISPNVAAIGADYRDLTGLSREPSTSQEERARRVVEDENMLQY